MPERFFKSIPEEVWTWILKILIPALIGIVISISIKMQKKRVKFIQIFLSVVIGVGTAYLTGTWILNTFRDDIAPIIIAVVTMLGEKIGYWLVYKFEVDKFCEDLIQRIAKK